MEGDRGAADSSWLELGLPLPTMATQNPFKPSQSTLNQAQQCWYLKTKQGQHQQIQQATKKSSQPNEQDGKNQAQQRWYLNTNQGQKQQIQQPTKETHQPNHQDGENQAQQRWYLNTNKGQQQQIQQPTEKTSQPNEQDGKNQAQQRLYLNTNQGQQQQIQQPTEEVNLPNGQEANIQHTGLDFDLNAPSEEASSEDEWWRIEPGETIHYEWSNVNNEYDQIVEWFEDESDHEDDNSQQQPPMQSQTSGKYTILKNNERNRVATILLVHSYNCLKLPRGMVNNLANQFAVSRHTIQRIWREAKKQYKDGKEVNILTKKAGRVGKKRITLEPGKLPGVPLRQRTSLRSLGIALNMSKSTLHRMVKRGEIKSHSNPMKPELTFTHKYQRMKWCVESIIPQTIHTIPRFHLLQNVIHVDEKWFMMSKLSQKYYLSPEECEPYRACRSKRFLLKIMFLAAVARPMFNAEGVLIWDGKIGIFPFTYKEAAKRSSKNRVAGTLETKAMQSITQEVMRDKFIHELLPAIKQKWPRHLTTTVWIQQDNAKPHILENDSQFIEACKESGLHIHLINQPAQSPDLNVLDLGFFRAIQSLKEQAAPKSVDELVNAVEKAYYDYCPKLTNYIFITLQNCMVEIMKAKGGNNYKIPHINKEGLERQGLLPNQVEVCPHLVHATLEWIRHGYLEEEEYILSLSRRQNQQARASTHGEASQNQGMQIEASQRDGIQNQP